MKNEIIELAKQSGFYQDTPMYYDEEMLAKFFRLAYTRGMLKQEQQQQQTQHWSDCAVHSEPAYPAGECDCGGYVTIKRIYAGLTYEETEEIITSAHSIREAVNKADWKIKEKNT